MNKTSIVRSTMQNKLMLASNCAICNKRNSRFFKKPKTSSLGQHYFNKI